MQFRQNSSYPYLNRAGQYRMLRMISVLLFVVVCIVFAADPQMWSWMFPKPAPDAAKNETRSEEIDFGVKFEEDSSLAADAFRSRAAAAKTLIDQPAVAESPPERLLKQANQTPFAKGTGPTTTIGDYVVEIDPALFADVSDDWLGIRRREAPAFYAVLAKASEIPLKLLEDAGDGQIDYTVLMTDSEQFRGRPVTVEGTIRRIDRVSISREEIRKKFGVNEFYVAWVFTASSGNSPYRLIAASVPPDMPAGENLEIPAKFTGYFFKRQGYQTSGGFHKAPVLIGKHIRWNRPPTLVSERPQDSGLAPYAIGLAVMIAIGLAVMIWRFNVSDKKFGRKHVDHFTSATPTALENLANLETNDPSDLFRQMREDAITADLDNEES